RRRVRHAGVGIEPARHVERKYWYATVIGPGDPACVHRVDGAAESDTEKAVDDEPEVAIDAPVHRGCATAIAPCEAGRRGVGRHAYRAVGRADDDVEK